MNQGVINSRPLLRYTPLRIRSSSPHNDAHKPAHQHLTHSKKKRVWACSGGPASGTRLGLGDLVATAALLPKEDSHRMAVGR